MAAADVEGEEIPNPEKDFYRDTPVRYLGYANEVGESFRAVVHRQIVNTSYGIASLYVLADVTAKTAQAWKDTNQNISKVSKISIDALIWQSLASVAVPGYIINRICYFGSKYAFSKSRHSKLATIVLGLCSIPFIIHPIDWTVSKLMDHTIRPILHVHVDKD